jgi:hypothetical protein
LACPNDRSGRPAEEPKTAPIETSLCHSSARGGLLLRWDCWPVLAGVKVVPARARGAGPGGAPPGLRLRSGWFGA